MHDLSVRFATRGNALGVDDGRKMDWNTFIFWGVEAGVVDRREAVVGTGLV